MHTQIITEDSPTLLPLYFSYLNTILMGLGATLIFDLWRLFLKYVFKITPSNLCLVGRWILYMPQGVFRHSNIGSAPKKSRECMVGWIAHYMTGIMFAIVFIASTGNSWLQHPALIPAMIFGVFKLGAILQYATFVRTWICCIKNIQTSAGKAS
jgi:hypothetical protein